MNDDEGIDIFISHSSRDAELAKAIAELFRGVFRLSAKRIRCTSVSGYKLAAGADTNEQLRKETVEARALVGLITEVSIDSAYVLFELGARWGAKKFLAPLLGAGRGPEIIAGPLTGLNALTCSRDDLFQLVGNVGLILGIEPESPEAYSGLLDRVVSISSEFAAQRGLNSDGAKNKTSTAEPRAATLSDYECEYLMTMGRPRNEGFIYGGLDDHRGREAAKYQDAVEHFQALGLVSYCSGGGHRFTHDGWKLYDQLWQLKILDALHFDAVDNHHEIAKAVQLTDGEAEEQELRRLLSEMEKRGFVRLTHSSGGVHIQMMESGLTHRKHRPLSL